MTEPQLGGTYQQLLDLALWAEREGMVSFARSDHYYSSRVPRPDATDAFATLAGLARDTASIRLCVLVSPITFRHPAVIAKTAATIDQMSGGRLDLGVGTGWMDLEHDVFGMPFPDWSERFDRFAESLPYLRAAFGEKHAKVTGTHYSIDAEVRPQPTGIRLVTGGSGPVRTPTLAGTYADEYNHLPAPIDEIARRNDVMRRAAAEAGRDPDSIEITVMGQVITAPDRRAFDERITRDAASRDMEAAALLDKWQEAGIPVGPPEEVTEILAAYERVGVNRYYLQWLDLADSEGLNMTWEVVKDSMGDRHPLG